MSYAMAAALQAAIYDRLRRDPVLSGLVGEAIYDAVPSGTLPDLYVALGEEQARDRSDSSGFGAEHRLTVTIWSKASGFVRAKEAAAAVSDALMGIPAAMSRGRLVGLWFDRADARRVPNEGLRRIDLRFRARVQDS